MEEIIKKLLIVILVLGSTATFANKCTLSITDYSYWNESKFFVKQRHLSNEAKALFENKGYILASSRRERMFAEFRIYVDEKFKFGIDDSYVYRISVKHSSGFEEKLSLEDYNKNHVVIHEDNLEIMRRAQEAGSISEREQILSEINTDLNENREGIHPYLKMAQSIRSCIDYIEK